MRLNVEGTHGEELRKIGRSRDNHSRAQLSTPTQLMIRHTATPMHMPAVVADCGLGTEELESWLLLEKKSPKETATIGGQQQFVYDMSVAAPVPASSNR